MLSCYMDQTLIIFFYLQSGFFCDKWYWGLVTGRRQSWLTNRKGWTKAWRGSIWHWLPPDKLTPFISITIVKLMSYVCNRLQWLEENCAKGKCGLDLDRQWQLEGTHSLHCNSARQGGLLVFLLAAAAAQCVLRLQGCNWALHKQ